MALSAQQIRFCEEYAISLNAKEAALAAGYSPKGAQTQGPRLLKLPAVRAKVDELLKRTSKKLEVTQERVVEEIARMAFYDPADLIPDLEEAVTTGSTFLTNGQQIRDLPENVRRAIVGWKFDKDGRLEIKLADKSKALDQLARHLSLYNDSLDVQVNDVADRLRRGRERVAKKRMDDE